jgi:hypothetical protein
MRENLRQLVACKAASAHKSTAQTDANLKKGRREE